MTPSFIRQQKDAVVELAARRTNRRKLLFPFLMMTPFYLLVLFFVVVPVILTLIMSFTDMGLTLKWNFHGPKNYLKIFQYSGMLKIVLRTLLFVGVCTAASVLGSIFIVVITTYYLDIVYKRENLGLLFRVIWLLPNLTPSVVYAFIWKFVFGNRSSDLINSMLGWFGVTPISWFMNMPMEILMIVCSLSSASGSIILFSSAVRQIPGDIFQSAKVDGASSLYICRRIVLPYLKWPITQKTLWSVLGFFCTYEIIRLLTEGGPIGKTTIYSYYIYQNAYDFKTFGLGAALSVFLVLMSSTVGLIVLKLFRVEKQLREPRMDI